MSACHAEDRGFESRRFRCKTYKEGRRQEKPASLFIMLTLPHAPLSFNSPLRAERLIPSCLAVCLIETPDCTKIYASCCCCGVSLRCVGVNFSTLARNDTPSRCASLRSDSAWIPNCCATFLSGASAFNNSYASSNWSGVSFLSLRCNSIP